MDDCTEKTIKGDFILYGEKDNYDIPLESMGKFFLDSLKMRNSQDIVMIDAETEEILTCEMLIKNSIKFAVLLQTFGIKKGDIISMINYNDIRYCEMLLGAWYNGVVYNPLNFEYSIGEFKNALNTVKPKLIICCKTALDKIIQLKANFDFPYKLITIGNETEKDGLYQDIKNLLLSVEINVQAFQPIKLNCFEDGALIQLSSGTTGLPKCVVLNHFSLGRLFGLFNSLDFCCTSLVTVQILPNFHLFGFLIQSLSMYSVKTILMKKFIPTLFLSTIEKYKVNLLYMVPSLLNYLCKNLLVDNYDTSSLRDIAIGASPVGVTLLNEAHNKFKNIFVRELYGCTEVGGASCIQTRKLYKPESTGLLCPGFIAKVCDINSNKTLGPFEKGEICLKSKQIMNGYLRNDTATRESFDEDGFYHTGDYGYYDNDKCFFICDRIKELIKYKGFQVAPAELENLINSIPGVQDCGVIGVSDERAGEVPLAIVVKQKLANITEKEIINFVAENISVQKHLYGGVIFTNELPKTGTGKILRKKLREQLKNGDFV